MDSMYNSKNLGGSRWVVCPSSILLKKSSSYGYKFGLKFDVTCVGQAILY